MTEQRSRTFPILPIACGLSPTDGRAQVAAWGAFDDDYLLEIEDRGTEYIAEYASTVDAEERLTRLVEVESTCCSFVTWSIERTAHRLRLVVGGTPDSLAALSIR